MRYRTSERGTDVVLRKSGNLIKILHGYDYHDRKHSPRWNRQQQSRTHSRRKRRRG